MKPIEEIQDVIKAICYQYGITLADGVLLAISVYISHEIIKARQDVFDMILDSMDKRRID